MWLMISHGFSPTAIEARFETVAELNALSFADYPHVGLEELLGWLETDESRPYYIRLLAPDRRPVFESPYHGMAREICAVLLEYIEDHPDAVPGLGVRRPRLDDIPLLSPDAVREAMRENLSGYGINCRASK
jgi:hypothetical protein